MKAARAEGRDDAFIDRLALTAKAIEAMAEGLREIAKLPDPVGEVSALSYRPSGIQVGRMRVPLGVIAIIYESRPNVTADAGGLCLKSGNACILRGGSESLKSNQAIAACVRAGLKAAGLPENARSSWSPRPTVPRWGELVIPRSTSMRVVPRGGKGLIERVAAEARVPVIKHLDGVCHVYIDDRADPAKAVAIADNAGSSAGGTCNTMRRAARRRRASARVLPEVGRSTRRKASHARLPGIEAGRSSTRRASRRGGAPEEDFLGVAGADRCRSPTLPGLDTRAIGAHRQVHARSTIDA